MGRLRVGEVSTELDGDWVLPAGISAPAGVPITLALKATKALRHTSLTGRFEVPRENAQASGSRRTYAEGAWQTLPLYRIDGQAREAPGARGEGPAILEEEFYSCRIASGWRFERDESGDILLRRRQGAQSQ